MKTQVDLLEEVRSLRRRVAELESGIATTEPLSKAQASLPLDERQVAYLRLFKQTQLLQSILDNIGDGIVVCDHRGYFLQFNPAAEELLGRGSFNTSRANWPEYYGLFLPDQQTPFPAEELPLSRSLRGEDIDNVEIYVVNEARPAGLWLSVTSRPLRDESGEVRGGIAVFRDVTESKVARATLLDKQRLLEHLLEFHERDRTLTACEIHDGMLQEMSAALIHLQSALHRLPPQAAQELETTRESIERGVTEGRRLIAGLRPPVLDEQGLLAALQMLADHHCTDEREVHFDHDALPQRLPPIVEGNLFRMVQECLNNVARHSEATEAWVELRHAAGQLQLIVRDNGIGFDPLQVRGQRFGLMGIRERAQMLGGSAQITSQPGSGTRLVVQLPWPAAAAEPGM
ncbi:MAG: PAS domain-containing protein [Pirellulales bacterium]|nr:PAS domain-containing protein [Pirellulales bacterium]